MHVAMALGAPEAGARAGRPCAAHSWSSSAAVGMLAQASCSGSISGGDWLCATPSLVSLVLACQPLLLSSVGKHMSMV